VVVSVDATGLDALLDVTKDLRREHGSLGRWISRG
jgi:hypothetical protein